MPVHAVDFVFSGLETENRQPLRMVHRQRPQQDGIHEAENGRIGADSERERKNRQRAEAFVGCHVAHCIAQVLRELFGQLPSPMPRASPPRPASRSPVRAAPPAGPRPPAGLPTLVLRTPLPDGIRVRRVARPLYPGDAPATRACGRMPSLPLLTCGIENQPNGARERPPLRLLLAQPLAARRRQAVVACPFALIGKLPRR